MKNYYVPSVSEDEIDLERLTNSFNDAIENRECEEFIFQIVNPNGSDEVEVLEVFE